MYTRDQHIYVGLQWVLMRLHAWPWGKGFEGKVSGIGAQFQLQGACVYLVWSLVSAKICSLADLGSI